MNQYRMQNRYTNHLPNHFYCRHGIDLNLSCSLCEPAYASRHVSDVRPHAPAELRDQGGGELRQTRPIPTGNDAGRSDAGDAAKGSK